LFAGEFHLSTLTAAKQKKSSAWSNSPIVPPLITQIVIWAIFWIAVPHFGSMRTVSNIFEAATISAAVVIGVTILMIAGEFDLSVGAIMAMAGYAFDKVTMSGGSPLYAVALALFYAAIMGAINGLLTVYTRIPSFIVTLGTRSIYRGLVWLYSGSIMLQTTDKLPIYDIMNGRLDIINNFIKQANFRTALVWVLLIGIIFQIILTRTRLGNHIFAAGGNQNAARAQGVNIKGIKIISFIISGTLAGFAGILTFSQFSTVFVATGTGLELTAIAAAAIGGTLMTGGVGSIFGSLLGILLLNVLRSGVILLGFPSDNFEAVVGITIIGAAVLNDVIRKRAA
jgi:simple sugar transport system permease protein